jgi:uncharacterized protein YdcH (DUF465 family)
MFLPMFTDTRVAELEQRIAELEDRDRRRDAQLSRLKRELVQLTTLLAERARAQSALHSQDAR